MLLRSRSIVLHTIKYNDESLITEVLTEEAGVVSFILRISRSSRSAVRHVLFRPLALLDIEWNHRTGGGLLRVKSAQISQPLCTIPYDARKTSIALFLAEFLHYAVRAEAEPRKLFAYIHNSIEWLDTCQTGYANFHLVFLMRLARFLGFEPNLEEYIPNAYFDLEAGRFTLGKPAHPHFLTPEDAKRLPLLMRMNFGTMRIFRFSGNERSRLLEGINTYYKLHLPAFPDLKSLPVLRELFDTER